MQRHHSLVGKAGTHPVFQLRGEVDFRNQEQNLRLRVAF